MDLEQLRQQRKQQNEQRRSDPVVGPAAIGVRQPNGLYDVAFVDGSNFVGRGLKVFDERHLLGDTVTAIPKQDGTIALEGKKAVPPEPNVFEDKCGNYLGGQVFTCPETKKETLDVWGLGLYDGSSSQFLHLINLKTGANYSLTSWPKKIQPCPIDDPNDDPNDPPPPPTPPPEDPDDGGQFIHHWQSSSGWSVGANCRGGIPEPPYGRLRYSFNDISILRTSIDLTTGLLWNSRFWTANWFDDQDNFIRRAGGVYFSTSTSSRTPPAVPQDNPCLSIVSGANVGNNQIWRRTTLSFNPATYVSTACPPIGPSPPNPPSLPRDPDKPPIDNSVFYTLSIDPQRRPIVRVKHTPQCKLGGYEYDAYFRLESTENGLRIKTYKGNSKMKDWRFDLADFPCKAQLKSNPWISFEIGRVWAWQAEPDKRPATLLSNGPPVESFIAKSTIAQDCTVPTGGEQPRIKYNAVYKGQGPSSLEIVSIAAYKRAG